MIKEIVKVWNGKYTKVIGYNEDDEELIECPITGEFVSPADDILIDFGISSEGLKVFAEDNEDILEEYGEKYDYYKYSDYISLWEFCFEDDVSLVEFIMDKYLDRVYN